VLRNAQLEFGSGARVEVESRFEDCSLVIGEGAELVIGPDGVLSGCKVRGSGRVTVYGKILEREAPTVSGIRFITVNNGGIISGTVEQAPERTVFAFANGSKLRMKITKSADDKGGRA
jgi:hypothetical protein